MVGFLYSLWARVEELDGIIHEDKAHRVIGVTFPNEAHAKGFMDTAMDTERWFDAISPKAVLNKNGREVHITWPH